MRLAGPQTQGPPSPACEQACPSPARQPRRTPRLRKLQPQRGEFVLQLAALGYQRCLQRAPPARCSCRRPCCAARGARLVFVSCIAANCLQDAQLCRDRGQRVAQAGHITAPALTPPLSPPARLPPSGAPARRRRRRRCCAPRSKHEHTVLRCVIFAPPAGAAPQPPPGWAAPQVQLPGLQAVGSWLNHCR